MNVLTRGMKNAVRSPIRTVAIVIMLAISMGLLLSMLVARSSINAKITDIKAATATHITINPSGVDGLQGGGDNLTTAQATTIKNTSHISSLTANLSDQLTSTDTNVTSPLPVGKIGRRFQRQEQGSGNPTAQQTARISINGTDNPSAVISNDKLISGTLIDGTTANNEAIIGKGLADKNNLKVNDTLTAYGKPLTVKGIYDVGNTFQNSGIIVSLATLQSLTNQVDAISSIVATVDSSDNVATAAAALKTSLGTQADIVTQQDQIAATLEPLQSISTLALAGVIGAAVAATIILLMTMITIVRERSHEIGVIKAIGGTNAKVIGQFITEALTLTFIGAVFGLALGILVSGPMTQSLITSSTQTANSSSQAGRQGGGMGRLGGGPRAFGQQVTTNIKQIKSAVTPTALASSIALIILVAMIGSAIPAWFIARIRPAEVLRTE